MNSCKVLESQLLVSDIILKIPHKLLDGQFKQWDQKRGNKMFSEVTFRRNSSNTRYATGQILLFCEDHQTL